MSSIKSMLAWITWPTIFIGSMFTFDRALSLGFDPGLTLFVLTVANMALIALLELWLPDRPHWSWTRDGQVVNDLVHGAGLQLGGMLGRATLSISFAAIGGLLTAQGGLGLWPNTLPLWGQVLLAVLIVDFFDYWKHRAYHGVALAWPIHALHHNPDRMNVFKAGRLNFLEATVRNLVVYAPLVAMGVPAAVLLWIAALENFIGNLNHSNLMQKLPYPAHALFASQKTHWLHHTKDTVKGPCNLSPFTMLFDHMFGTFRHPLNEPLDAVGIDPDPIPSNVFAQIASPLLWPVLMWRLNRRKGNRP
jgi:ornithine lipid hydroxylase